MSDAEMLAEILVNSRQTRRYIKYQLIITVAVVVLPLLAVGVLLPFAIKSLGSVYGASGILQEIQ